MLALLHSTSDFLYLAHDSEGVTSVNFLDVRGGIAFFQQCASQVRKFGDIVESFGCARNPVEVAADADGIHPRDLPDVINVSDHVSECGALAPSFPLLAVHLTQPLASPDRSRTAFAAPCSSLRDASAP